MASSTPYPIPSPSPSPIPPSPSPTARSSFLIPNPTPNHYSPTKPPRTQPNAHPYAIKTTSTALLSRSTSSSASAGAAVHRYVPPSPSPTSASAGGDGRSPTSPVGHHRQHQHTRHRYSRSLTSDLPAPLPPPPSGHGHGQTQSSPAGYTSEDLEDDTPKTRRRMQRAETLPSGTGLPFPSSLIGTGASAGVRIHPDLPDDPKAWTPAQLGVYLASAADVQGSSDLAAFVQERQISGRAFLRLDEGALDSLPPHQRASLLAASRALRQQNMRGRIFGPSAGSGSEHHGNHAHTTPFTNSNNNEDEDGAQDHVLSTLSTSNITRRNGINIRPRRRSRHSSLASDSSEASSASFSSNASAASSQGGRVRGIVDEFESRFEEEGSTGDTSYGSSLEERRRSRSPVKTRFGGQVQGGTASPVPSPSKAQQQHRLPQRPAVTDLFGFGPVSGTDNYDINNNGSNGNNGVQPNPPDVDKDEFEEEKDPTITNLARKNVHGREARLLPFPPSAAAAGGHQGWLTPVHTGAQYALPASPDPSASPYAGYTHAHAHEPPHHHHQQAHAYTHLSPPTDYELGLRHAVSPSHLNLNSSVPPTVTSSPRLADPHSQTYVVVQHNPSPPLDGGSLTARGSNARGGGGKGQRLLPYPPVVGQGVLHHPRPRRVIGVGNGEREEGDENKDGLTPGVEGDVESEGIGALGGGWVPPPANEVGVSDVETDTTETETETDAWETANEGPPPSYISSNSEVEEGEEELSMEELLRTTQAQGPDSTNSNTLATPISGAEAWEMELGETVKRISSSSSSLHVLQSNAHSQSQSSFAFRTNGKRHTHGGASVSARDVPEIGRKAGRSGGSGSVTAAPGTSRDKFGTGSRRGGILSLFDPPPAPASAGPAVAEDDNEAQDEDRSNHQESQGEMPPPPVPEKDTVADPTPSTAKGTTQDPIDVYIDQREKDLNMRVESLSAREVQLDEAHRLLEVAKEDVASRSDSVNALQATLEALKERLGEKEVRLDVREVEVGKREMEVGVREEAVGVREEAVKVREELLREREEAVRERERLVELGAARLLEEREEVERNIKEVEEKAAALVDAEAGTDKGHSRREEFEFDDPDINPTRPEPYLASPWSIKRDYLLGRFIGLFPLPFIFSSSGHSSLSSSATDTTTSSSTNTTDTDSSSRGTDRDANINGHASRGRRGRILDLLRLNNLNWRSLTALAGQGGGYVVLMSIGVCAVVLRVLGRRLLGAGAAAGGVVGARR